MDINQTLKQNNFTFAKKFGQNFITDTNLLSAIVSDAGINGDDIVLEVGAGAGTLTRALAAKAKEVISFEIDTRLEPVLNQTLSGVTNTRLVFKDILRAGYDELFALTGGQKYKVVANLPYYITTPVIFYFLEDNNCSSLSIMVQKEVAERLTAKEGSPEYGAVTAQVKIWGEAKIMRIVKRNMFYPEPNVDSAVVRIDIQKKSPPCGFEFLRRVIAAAFDMRRKTLVNNLAKNFAVDKDTAAKIFGSIGLDTNIRGEALSLERFTELAVALKQAGVK